jgi:RHS repeat-associated protein
MTGKTFTWLGGWGYRQTGVEWSSVYMRARHYSRGLSNWTSIDPLWPSEMAYGYVEGRVMTGVDPSGLDAVPFGFDSGNYVSPSLKKFLSHFGDCDVDTRSVCGAIAGPVPCLTCLQRSGETVEKWSIRQAQAYKAGRNNFNANDRNALRHCVWACDATRSCGCECAHKVDLKEIADRFRYGSTSRSDSKCDLINNRVGRIIAQINPNKKSCPTLCTEMLLEGNLCITSGKFNR